ncbi:MAG TPA: prolyl oligopeptidase family serine peptidase [Allosphingosinicella sp.]
MRIKTLIGRTSRSLGRASLLAAALVYSAAALAQAGASQPSAAPAPFHALTMDDILGQTRIDSAAISPNGQWAAVVVQRPVRNGEVFGRTFYETDPSRNDVWLVSLRTGERRNLTNGSASAAGFWCATWSPDGQRLAMLSTMPEGAEPRGGDNVRLYVWNARTGGLSRAANTPIVTQPRYGSGLYHLDVRGGANQHAGSHTCNGNENAPFAWLSDSRILAVTAPGQVSGLIDEYWRPTSHAVETAAAMRDASRPTFTASESGPSRRQAASAARVTLQVLDTDRSTAAEIGTVPFYPFRGELTVSIAPGGRRIAILAPIGAIVPQPGEGAWAAPSDAWTVERRLGFATADLVNSIRWVGGSEAARFPLELFDWSADGQRIALRARASGSTLDSALFAASERGIERVSSSGFSFRTTTVGLYNAADPPAIWVDDHRLIALMAPAAATTGGATRADWWLFGRGAATAKLTGALAEVPSQWRRAAGGALVTPVGGRLLAVDARRRVLVPFATAQGLVDGYVIWPAGSADAAATMLVEAYGPANTRRIQAVNLRPGASTVRTVSVPATAKIEDVRGAGPVVWSDFGKTGLFLDHATFEAPSPRRLLALNQHLADRAWGEETLINYAAPDGGRRNASVILPPGYVAGERRPVIVWTYPGTVVRQTGGYHTAPQQPGVYNLHLYAARGYIVLVPSIPLPNDATGADIPSIISESVAAAVDDLVRRGMADAQRVGILGQSYGGYAAFALAGWTNRYRAIVAIAGITDLALYHSQFDRTARGYPGIEHEKSLNRFMRDLFGLASGPHADAERYRALSPIFSARDVTTPLLMIHGEYDTRGDMIQAEMFFSQLEEQGKTARLLRYWGDNHALALSPANVRSVFDETIAWFDRYLASE